MTLEQMLERIFEWLGRFDIVISLFAMIFSILTFNSLRQRNKRYQELVRHEAPVNDFDERIRVNNGVRSSDPVALALALTPNINAESIRKDIAKFISTEKGLRNLKTIECIDIDGINTPEERKQLVTELRAMRRKLSEEGCTELHLFIAGPGAAAALAGAIFDNWIPVKLYAPPNNKTGGVMYEYWMPLDIVKGS